MPSLPAPRTVHIVDDDAAIRDSLCLLFKASELSAESYQGGRAFLEKLPEIDGGCVLIDVNMPGMTGIELLSAIKQSGSTLPCIVMTGSGEIPLAVKAMKAGAADFIEKPFEEEILMEAVRSVLGGQDPANIWTDARLSRLTPRERDVMTGIARGQQNKVMAQELGISPRTVEIHRARVMTKLEAESIADVVRIAMQAGLKTG